MCTISFRHVQIPPIVWVITTTQVVLPYCGILTCVVLQQREDPAQEEEAEYPVGPAEANMHT